MTTLGVAGTFGGCMESMEDRQGRLSPGGAHGESAESAAGGELASAGRFLPLEADVGVLEFKRSVFPRLGTSRMAGEGAGERIDSWRVFARGEKKLEMGKVMFRVSSKSGNSTFLPLFRRPFLTICDQDGDGGGDRTTGGDGWRLVAAVEVDWRFPPESARDRQAYKAVFLARSSWIRTSMDRSSPSKSETSVTGAIGPVKINKTEPATRQRIGEEKQKPAAVQQVKIAGRGTYT